MIGKVGRLMKIRSQWFLVFIIILLFSLAGCKSQESPMEYGIVVQLDREWWPKNLLEYPFTHWTYMFKPNGTKIRPPIRLGVYSIWRGEFSPDGKYFAYSDWNMHLYLMRVSDGKKVSLSDDLGKIAINNIKWLEDDRTIVYGDDKVYIQDVGCLLTEEMPSNCLPPPAIIKLGVNRSFCDISPDGTRIIYTYAEYEEGHKIVKWDVGLMEVASSSSISLKTEGDYMQFVGNTTILIRKENNIYIAEIDNNKLISKKLIAKLAQDETSFSLSPDGKYLAFISSQRGDGLGEVMRLRPWNWDSVTTTSALFIMDIATGKAQRLTYPNDHDVIWYGWYPLR